MGKKLIGGAKRKAQADGCGFGSCTAYLADEVDCFEMETNRFHRPPGGAGAVHTLADPRHDQQRVRLCKRQQILYQSPPANEVSRGV
jgi:hypothetical protein